MEDFFLNRLMLVLRKIDFTGALEGNGGEYTARYKSLNVNIELLNAKINEKTGVHDAKINYKRDYRVQWMDELLNETEALELTNSNEIHERWILLLGKRNSFLADMTIQKKNISMKKEQMMD